MILLEVQEAQRLLPGTNMRLCIVGSFPRAPIMPVSSFGRGLAPS